MLRLLLVFLLLLTSPVLAGLKDSPLEHEGRDNLASITDALTPSNSEAFTYTPRESLSGATGPYGSMGFTYDGVGNRVSYSLGAATDTYIYPLTSNRLSTISLAAGGTREFTYDAAGNTTFDNRTGGAYGYTYNAAGRMESFSINGFLQAQYIYDALGRQAVRTLTSPTPVTIHSVFDSDGRRIAEYVEATGALIREYVWNGWDPVAVIESGTVYFIRADHIGRPVFATNASGAKVWTATYQPFGGVHTSTGDLPTARFPGQWFQSESGLHQNWMRDYDPTTGRYLQADPLGLVDGASVYGYVKQSPMMLMDPTGEFIPAAIVGGAVLGAGISILLQMLNNGGDIWCIDWTQVGIDAALGGALGGVGLLGKAFDPALKGLGIGKPRGSIITNFFENSHFIPSRSLPSSGLGKYLGNSSLNTSYVSYIRHAITDKYAHRFLPKRLKPYVPQIPAPLNLPFRMPPWMYGWVPSLFGDPDNCTCTW